jgi:hypothetical protein
MFVFGTVVCRQLCYKIDRRRNLDLSGTPQHRRKYCKRANIAKAEFNPERSAGLCDGSHTAERVSNYFEALFLTQIEGVGSEFLRKCGI